MKKSTLSTVIALLSDLDFENKEELMNELYTDANRDAEKKAAKNAEYDTAWEVVSKVLADGIYTATDIYNECAKDLPDGFTKGRVVYGLTHQWADRVQQVEGNPATYGLKA